MTSEIVSAGLGVALGGSVVYLTLRRSRARPSAPPASASLQASGDRFIQATLQLLPVAALLVDRAGRIVYCNSPAQSLFGIPVAKADGRAIIEAVPSVDLERQVRDALAGARSTRDLRLLDRSIERHVRVTVEAFEPFGAVIVALDRTELDRLERLRSELISNVSHELRTPLSAIKLMVETMIGADDDADARALFMPRVAAEVDRIVQLVEDLLAMTRSESGRLVMRKERFDLTDVAVSVIDTFSQRARRAAVELDVDAPEPVMVEADRDRLVQVAVNLVDNALRHTPPGGSVSLSVAPEAPWAVLRVRDTGVGIAHADLDKIFDRFYVADRSRSRGQSGTGLGLSIARNLVEAHGGRLDVDSILGRGATFTVRLPWLPSSDQQRLMDLNVDLSQP